jgi:hypothetical protein
MKMTTFSTRSKLFKIKTYRPAIYVTYFHSLSLICTEFCTEFCYKILFTKHQFEFKLWSSGLWYHILLWYTRIGL